MKRFTGAFVAALLLAACFVDLDWREVRPAGAGFAAWLPARPVEESRPLAGRNDVQMRQWTARARNTVFAVGYADFPKLDEGVVDEVRNALVANIGGRIQAQRTLSLPEARAVEVEALGAHGGATLKLHVRLLPRGKRLYQIATLGPPDDLRPGEQETFFDALKLDPMGR